MLKKEKILETGSLCARALCTADGSPGHLFGAGIKSAPIQRLTI